MKKGTKSKKTMIVLLLLFIGVAVAVVYMWKGVSGQIYEQKAHDTAFGTIMDGHSLVAKLPIESDTVLSEADIHLATYADVKTCQVDFCLYKNGDEVYRHTENAANLQDNAYYALEDIMLPCGPGDEVYLEISSPETKKENAITAWLRSGKDDNAPVYKYNANTGAVEQLDFALDEILYERCTLNGWLYREWPSEGVAGGAVMCLLGAAVLLLAAELLPKDMKMPGRGKK